MNEILSYNDLWHTLKQTSKPIVLYGMGDGADKIIDVCNSINVPIRGVFASDGFAKKKLFRGFEVTTYSDICNKFDDFIVLVSFATQRTEVLDNIYRIAGERELYCPDVPVFGSGLFDKSFVTENYTEIEKVYNSLSDDISKNTYKNIILGKMTGNIRFIRNAETEIQEAYETIIKPKQNFHYVDIGAYNGDTIRELMSFSTYPIAKITAFEPDLKNFTKLCAFAEENGIDTSDFHNAACWDKDERLEFYSRSGRNSAKTSNHSDAKTVLIKAVAADSVIDSSVDFINIDAEGSDARVIKGLNQTIQKYKPLISCAVYHRNEDMFAIPLQLMKEYGECDVYIRHFRYLPAWDTNVYVCPKINN